MELQDVKALEAVLNALKDLQPEVKERVLRWAAESLDLRAPARAAPQKLAAPAAKGTEGGTDFGDYETIADAVSASQASTDAERVLVAAAFLSKKDGKTELTSAEINAELKNLGHSVGSINKVMDFLKDRKPQLMVQTGKSGSSKQARKSYKVTGAGFDKVNKMLAGQGNEE